LGTQEFTIVVSGYKFKVERVVANLNRLIESISRNKLQSSVLTISQEEHNALNIGGIFEKLQSELNVKISSSDQQVEELILVLPNQQTLVLTSLYQSSEDTRDYVNVFFNPNDWAEALPDQALDSLY